MDVATVGRINPLNFHPKSTKSPRSGVPQLVFRASLYLCMSTGFSITPVPGSLAHPGFSEWTPAISALAMHATP